MSKTIGQIFEENKAEIAGIFEKYGIDADPTPHNAGVAYKTAGPSFARDMACVLYPEHCSNLDGDDTPAPGSDEANKTANAVAETTAILGGLSKLAGAAGGMFHKRGAAPINNYPPDHHGDHGPGSDKGKDGGLWFGFKPVHIGMVTLLLIAVGAYILLSNDKPVKPCVGPTC